jgi:hypothetical protein
MKNILIVGTRPEEASAISSVVDRICHVLSSTFQFSFFSINYGHSKPQFLAESASFLMSDPISGFFHVGRRIERKLSFSLGLDTGLFASREISSKLSSTFEGKSFDCVIAVAGNFAFFQAAFSFAKRSGLPLCLFYVDPFTSNPFAKNSRKRYENEKRWLDYCETAFYDKDGPEPPLQGDSSKMVPFLIPLDQKEGKFHEMNRSIVYGGSFYPGIREPDGLIDLARRKDMSEFTFEIYTDCFPFIDLPNVNVHPLIPKNEYLNKISNASATVVVGNSTNLRYQPSKYLEAISLKCPIIGVNNGAEIYELQKYPLYFDSHDPELPKKIQSLQARDFSFDAFQIYPDRDPKVVGEIFKQQLIKILK